MTQSFVSICNFVRKHLFTFSVFFAVENAKLLLVQLALPSAVSRHFTFSYLPFSKCKIGL